MMEATQSDADADADAAGADMLHHWPDTTDEVVEEHGPLFLGETTVQRCLPSRSLMLAFVRRAFLAESSLCCTGASDAGAARPS